MSRIRLLSLQVLVAVVALGLWQFFASVPVFGRMWLPPFFFSNPVDVFSQIVHWFATGTIWKHLVITLWESTLAFVIGSLGGVLVGFWFARQPRVGAFHLDDRYLKRGDLSESVDRAYTWLNARVKLRELRLEQFTMEDVDAVVVESQAQMGVSLLGMSFLSRLDGYEMRDGAMIMSW